MMLSGVILLLLGIVVVGWISVNAFRFLLSSLFPSPKRPEYNMYTEKEREVINSILLIIQEFQVRNPGKKYPTLKKIQDISINHLALIRKNDG